MIRAIIIILLQVGIAYVLDVQLREQHAKQRMSTGEFVSLRLAISLMFASLVLAMLQTAVAPATGLPSTLLEVLMFASMSLGMFSLASYGIFWLRHRRQLERGGLLRCPTCDYDLRAGFANGVDSATCPECGRAYFRRPLEEDWKTRYCIKDAQERSLLRTVLPSLVFKLRIVAPNLQRELRRLFVRRPNRALAIVLNAIGWILASTALAGMLVAPVVILGWPLAAFFDSPMRAWSAAYFVVLGLLALAIFFTFLAGRALVHEYHHRLLNLETLTFGAGFVLAGILILLQVAKNVQV